MTKNFRAAVWFLVGVMGLAGLRAIPAQAIEPGTYLGLIRNDFEDDQQHSGSLKASVTTGGNFTARLQWQGFAYTLSGKFAVDEFIGTLTKQNGGELQVRLVVSDGQTLSGKITDGSFVSLIAARKPFYSRENPCRWPRTMTGLLERGGTVTFIPNTPFSLQVSGTGAIRMAGRLNDTTPFITSSWLVTSDRFPVYFSVYPASSRGSVWGEVQFQDAASLPFMEDDKYHVYTDGSLQWFRPQQPSRVEPNVTVQTPLLVRGLRYWWDGRGDTVLPPQPGPVPAKIFLFFGDIPGEGLQADLWLLHGSQFVVMGANRQEIRVYTNPFLGTFQGSFRHPRTKRTTHFSGVFRKLAGGSGCFAGPESWGEAGIMGLD